MYRKIIAACLLLVGASSGAFALTGSGDSAVIQLETIPPTLQSVSPATERGLLATFSEPMLAPGVTTPTNYAVSGLGAGTLNVFPTAVDGLGPYTLMWTTGEMRNGAPLTLTVTGVRDALGNQIDPAHNSASCTGLGAPPVFSNLAVAPSIAVADELVTITFSVSEPLNGDPIVTVNGHGATLGSHVTNYTYDYVIWSMDALGAADVSISGYDLAGNYGSISDNTLLEIVAPQPTLPLRGWPVGVGLLAASLLVLTRRQPWKGPMRHLGAVLFVLALLVPHAAVAQGPTVSNVTVSQGPSLSGGTQVDVYYDLVAPNGPCAVTVSLSENGGADGFIYPITKYSGDIAGVTTGAHHHILWNIAADYPDEDIPQARIRVTANDGIVQHALTYTPGPNGTISGATSQLVNHGGNGTAVTAVPNAGHHFVQWSDGSTQNPRMDTGVTVDINVTAVFVINLYTLIYTSSGKGAILGTSPQTVAYGANGTTVTAVPNAGYHFVQWDDASTQNPRTDTNVRTNLSVTASFAINAYTLSYAAGTNGSISGTTPQTANYGGAGTAVTAAPSTGYHFVQWSDGILTPTRTDMNVTANISVTASFAINTYMLTYTAGANGTVSGASPQTVTYGASSTAVTATPNTGSYFVQWSDGILTPTRTDTNVTANISVTANFAIYTYTLTYAAGANGTIAGPSSQTVNYGASGTAVTAAPNSGYLFMQWSDASTQNPRTDTNVTAALSVTADFGAITPEMLSVPAGTFTMGNSGVGDDLTYGLNPDELPTHAVTLSAYQIGKCLVTNKQYCDVLNWALAKGYLKSSVNTPWQGTGDIYAGANLQLIVSYRYADCNVQYSTGVFSAKTRVGLPGSSNYSTATHPVLRVSWYGAAAFCNWLSQMQGLTPCYDMTTANWPLTAAPPTSGGYRLPTEAEWERAAAWDGSKHWIYGFTGDTLTGKNRANYSDFNPDYVNPLGLTTTPDSSPISWFNGINISPNGSVTTVNGVSPAGCYDMSGNVAEWCGDWYSATYYSGGAMTNPTGPASGSIRVYRGGGWYDTFAICRSAVRNSFDPANASLDIGFRIAK